MAELQPLTIGLVLTHFGADLSTVRDDTQWCSIQCPFHGDRHASGRVNLSTGGFKCNACDVYGDAVSTIARAEGLGTVEQPDRRSAIEWAKENLDAVPVDNPQPRGKAKPKKKKRHDAWRKKLFT